MENTDYSGYEEDPNSALLELSVMADAQVAAEITLKNAEAEVQRAKEALRSISEDQIPEMMDKLDLEEYTPKGGRPIKILEKIRASIPKAKQPEAFGWLRAHNHSKMIKHKITCDFAKGEDDSAREMADILEDHGLEFSDSLSVHPSTLSAFVSEKLGNGEEIPLDLFGVFRQRIAKVG